MNCLNIRKRAQVVAALGEGKGTSINATCRMTGVAKHTVLNLLRDLGGASAAYHHHNVRGLRVRQLQCDEIWSFVGAKRKNASPEKRAQGWGDVWTGTPALKLHHYPRTAALARAATRHVESPVSCGNRTPRSGA